MQEGAILCNRYRLERLLGRGGMADVYLAFDLRRQAHIAVKVLREDLAEDPEFVRRFSREAEALAKLDHPNIVRFYSLEQEADVAFIVMDYVPGTNLQRRLKEADGPLPLEEINTILYRVGSALQYAHNEGYIHRDIKPGNIMLREDGTPLLSDFGIARATESATAATLALGTPAYMSPEQIKGQNLDHRADIYSLGIVLYEMVTGRRPFTGNERGLTGTGTIEKLRTAHLKLNPPDPRTFNPNLSPSLAAVILRALAKNPNDRWQDVVSLMQAWSAIAGPAPQRIEGRPVGSGTPTMPLSAGTGYPTPSRVTPASSFQAAGRAAPSSAGQVITPPATSRGGYAGPMVETPRPTPPRARSRGPWWAIAAILGIALILFALLQWVLPSVLKQTTRAASTPSSVDLPGTASALVSAYGTATAETLAQALATGTTQARATFEAAAPWLTVTAQWQVATTEAKATVEALSAERATATAVIAITEQARSSAATDSAKAALATSQAASTATASASQAKATADAQATSQAAARTATAQAAPRSTPVPTAPPAPAAPGVVVGFGPELTWQLGDQPYGKLESSNEQARGSGPTGRLRYDFPAVSDNFVVFLAKPPISIPGKPAGLTLWVYGDNSGHYLNAWLQDATGEVRQYTFEQIKHQGWQQLVAPLDEKRGWPNGHISGPDDGVLTFPASLYALVLDGVPDGRASSGVIYLDDLATTDRPVVQATSQAPAARPTAAAPAATVAAAPARLTGRIVVPVFAADRGTYDLYVANADGSNLQRVLDFASQPALRNDGQWLAFRRWKSDDRGIEIMQTYGGGQKRLTKFVEDALPSWSPNGQTLVFMSRRESDRKARIYQVNITGGSDWELKRGSEPVFGEYPTWMPDGRILYRVTWPEQGIAIMNSDGAGMKLIFSDGSATAPAVAPSGQFVAFMSQRDGSWDVYRVNINGSEPLRLTTSGANDGLPAWSPDGASIAFVSDREGGWAVWVMNADGSGQRKLFALPGSPEGYVPREGSYSTRGWVEERISWAP